MKIPTSGTPSAAATWRSPVSTPTTTAAPAISAATSSSGLRSGTSPHPNAAAISIAAPALRRGPPRQHHLETAIDQRARQREPMRLRPLLADPRGPVDQHGIGVAGLAGDGRAIEPEFELRLRLIAERAVRSACGCAESHGSAIRPGGGHRRTARPGARGCSPCRSRGGRRAPPWRSTPCAAGPGCR